jgi:hypothetical protein
VPVAAADMTTVVLFVNEAIYAPEGMCVPAISRCTSFAVKFAVADVTVVVPFVTRSDTERCGSVVSSRVDHRGVREKVAP